MARPRAGAATKSLFTIFPWSVEITWVRKKYASDINREKFEEILPLLQNVRRCTKPTQAPHCDRHPRISTRRSGDHGRGDGCKGALQAIHRCQAGLARVQSLLADGGYVGRPFALGVQEILGEHVTVQIAKRSELHTFKVIPKRWVIERSFAWLAKNRRLWKNCERLLNTSLHFVHLAFLGVLLRRS